MDGGQLVAEAARDRIRAAAEFLDPSQFGLPKGSNEYLLTVVSTFRRSSS